LLILVISASRE